MYIYIDENLFQKGFCGDSSIFIVEIMSQLKLDHHRKPGSTGRPFRPIMGLLSSAHPRSRTREIRTQDLPVEFYQVCCRDINSLKTIGERLLKLRGLVEVRH